MTAAHIGADRLVEDQAQELAARGATKPVAFVMEALRATPDPGQCDVLDACTSHDNLTIRAALGRGLLKGIMDADIGAIPADRVPRSRSTDTASGVKR